MTRFQSSLVVVLALSLSAAFAAQAQAQGRGGSRSSLLGLLRIEQVQKELKLDDEAVAKVGKLREKIRGELTEPYTAARKIEDREKRFAKYVELRNQSDRKAREGLRDVLEREQMMRLYQIRMQVRAVADSLENRYVARRLKLTDEQKEKLAKINKDARAKRSKLFSGLRDASDEQRREAFEKFRKLRTKTGEQALALLTAEQKKAFEDMQGEKIELPSRRRRS
ncbi:MAG: Spy/CpxP family protein refolding chaperone [Planctomycetes bacterium]|nr:Spy/CpxP family protein refolding chaperone [Planctomycetota bacterium]